MLARRASSALARPLCRAKSGSPSSWRPRFAEFVPVPVAASVGSSEAMEANSPEGARCVHATIVGAPNAGKSVLLNRLVNREVSAVSSKYHTTRVRTVGVHTEGVTQLCLHDTPGLVDEGSARFQHHLIAAAKEALALCDVALVTVDAAARLTDERRALLQALMVETAQAGVRPWLVLNKMDLVKPRWRPHKEEEYRAAAAAAFPTLTEVFAISAQHGTGVPELRQRLLAAAPEGEWMYAAEAHTDLSKLAQVEELVRAKVFKYTYKEVPYQVTQRTLGWREHPDGVLRIDQQLQAHTAQHYRILKGPLASKIEEDAQQAIADAFNQPVRLVLAVVHKRTRSKGAKRQLKELGMTLSH